VRKRSGEKSRIFVRLLWAKGGCLPACAGASWWCRAAGGRRRSRRGR
jgi:hypothetical protein